MYLPGGWKNHNLKDNVQLSFKTKVDMGIF